MPSRRQAAGGDTGTRPLWFSPPDGEENRRRSLTRDRVVAARPQNTADRRPRPARWLAPGLAASLPRTPGHVLERGRLGRALPDRGRGTLDSVLIRSDPAG